MLKDTFSFAERQEKATYGFGYKLKVTRKKDEAAINKAPGSADARSKINYIHWHVLHLKPSILKQGILSKQIFSKTPTQLRYTERSFS